MEKPTYKLVGQPCGHHGQYTFYKALRICGEHEQIIAIGDFFFVKVWQDSELISIGELQLLWTDRTSDQTLVSLRLYFLPENTPDGRNGHGEDEVLAINEKVVLRADDLLSWLSTGTQWHWGLKAVWRGACTPTADTKPSAPLFKNKMDFSDIDKEKSTIETNATQPGVVVFSYPRYCRYRALLRRLEGIQAHWLRDSLVAALGGYAAATNNTRILYCKDTFEYPELEGHEFVCNQLAPKVKGRPRGRRKRRRSSPSERDSDTDHVDTHSHSHTQLTPRRHSLRLDYKSSDDNDKPSTSNQDEKKFIRELKHFYKERNEAFKIGQLKDSISFLSLYNEVQNRGGFVSVSRRRHWKQIHSAIEQRPSSPNTTRVLYERYLLPYENSQLKSEPDNHPSDIPDSPEEKNDVMALNTETGETEPLDVKEPKEPIQEYKQEVAQDLVKVKTDVKTSDSKISIDLSKPADKPVLPANPISSVATVTDNTTQNGFNSEQKTLPKTTPRSSLRSVRVKPAREARALQTNTSLDSNYSNPLRPDSASSSPPVTSTTATNFGINYPKNMESDDEIIEVPYKPKTPDIIDLDNYPESPKKQKLEMLKEAGLEVTPLPTWPVFVAPPLQTQLFPMYLPYNGIPPPKIIQGKSIFGSSGPEKTVYGNPKDPFMPPPHVLRGAPIKPAKQIPTTNDLLDLTCKTSKPAVEIMKVPSPSKNYTLIDGKAVVGSNLEITLVTKNKKKPSTSNGQVKSPSKKKTNLVIPNFQASEVKTPETQKLPPFIDPMYMSALYSSLAGQLDSQQLALYRELMANQFRYPMLNMSVPTTKN